MANVGINVTTNTLSNSELYKVRRRVKAMAAGGASALTIMGKLNSDLDYDIYGSMEGSNFVININKK